MFTNILICLTVAFWCCTFAEQHKRQKGAILMDALKSWDASCTVNSWEFLLAFFPHPEPENGNLVYAVSSPLWHHSIWKNIKDPEALQK